MQHGARALVALFLAAVLSAACRAPEAAALRYDAADGLSRVESSRAVLASAWDRLDALRDEERRLTALEHQTASERARLSEVETLLPSAGAAFEAAYLTDQATLTDFLNTSLAAAPRSPQTRAALDLYAQSAVHYARDIVETAGDYRRAVELLETARGYYAGVGVPPPRSLAATLERISSYRVATRARFERLARGMREADVKALLGVPFSGNVHRSEVGGRRVTTWLYGSDEKGVAAVYFDERGALYAWRWDVLRDDRGGAQ